MNKIKIILEKIKNKHIEEYTAECAYYTILSFIPTIMLILTLTKYVGIDEPFLFSILEECIPSNLLNDAVMGIIREVYSKSVGTITISAIFILWSAGNGFFALCKGLNAVYEVETKNKTILFRIRAILSTVIFIFSIIFSLILLVFGNSINGILQEKFHIFSSIIHYILKFKIIISTILLTFIFTIIYKFIPKHNDKLKNQIPGAFFAAIACNLISIFYSIYVQIFTGFSIMYGSLTTIVLAMMWVYACMYSVLLGAVLNNIMKHNKEH